MLIKNKNAFVKPNHVRLVKKNIKSSSPSCNRTVVIRDSHKLLNRIATLSDNIGYDAMAGTKKPFLCGTRTEKPLENFVYYSAITDYIKYH